MGNFFAHVQLTTHGQLFEVQCHQILKIGLQFLLAKAGEKFGLGGFVDFANAVD
jgi:hypothetical protein